MKKVLPFILCASLLSMPGVSLVSAADISENNPVEGSKSCIVSWSTTYSSLDDMLDDVDKVISGKVTKQTVEKRAGLFFTHSIVESQSGKIYDVLQTGAIVNGIENDIPDDIGLMQIEKSYFLCLDEVQDEIYGDYYLIAGGTQGVAEITDDGVTEAIGSSERNLFGSIQFDYATSDELHINEAVYSTERYTDPNPEDYKWADGTSTVYFYCDSNIAYNFGSSVTTKLRAGILSWGNYTPFSINYTTKLSLADVRVYMAYYGETGWDGKTYITGTGEEDTALSQRETIKTVGININASNLYDASSITNVWKAIACHEMGHGIGLIHTSKTNSIMQVGQELYYGKYGHTTPQSYDEEEVTRIYG